MAQLRICVCALSFSETSMAVSLIFFQNNPGCITYHQNYETSIGACSRRPIDTSPTRSTQPPQLLPKMFFRRISVCCAQCSPHMKDSMPKVPRATFPVPSTLLSGYSLNYSPKPIHFFSFWMLPIVLSTCNTYSMKHIRSPQTGTRYAVVLCPFCTKEM